MNSVKQYYASMYDLVCDSSTEHEGEQVSLGAAAASSQPIGTALSARHRADLAAALRSAATVS